MDEAQTMVQQVMDEVARAASRFDAGSEVHALLDGSPRTVSPVLRTMLGLALDAAEATAGALDPTLGRVLVGLGYDDAVPAHPVVPVRVQRAATWRDVRLDRAEGVVQVPAGTLLDLGATAKAFAADVAAERVSTELRAERVVVGIGGDLAVRCPEGRRLPIQVAERPDGAGQSLLVGAGGVATSSTLVRRWRTLQGQAHHILDPASGEPARGPWRSVSVCAQTCVQANHAATAAVVTGADAVGMLLALDVPALLVDRAGALTRLGGWPEQDVAA